MTGPCSTLLIVDDEEGIRRQLEAYLEDQDGFSVLSTASGEEALQRMAEHPVDLCIVDMRLPGMTGEAFIALAAARGLCRHFLVHTGSLDLVPGPTLLAAGVGPDDVFVKPHGAEGMLRRIRHILGDGGPTP